MAVAAMICCVAAQALIPFMAAPVMTC